ncbi:MAG: hypothetical protein COW42_07760 [Deltaproteobacteria bacterium CG17_big_fil_post_rev_8_21_14_2_50_63_7]|nr:MAG: hypothetical protein COW42_07760 [Deltaproteobacteria bacterium CG17_big_fil_post_rev_8_21_14_2_50_63_7]
MTLETVELVLTLLLVDLLVAGALERNPYVDHGYGVWMLLAGLVACQYLVVGMEFVARHRDDVEGFTLPIVFLPLGRSLRFVLVVVSCLLVLLPKLTFYFVILTIGVPLLGLLTRVAGQSPLLLIDGFDSRWERLERATNALFNLLHYAKIDNRGSSFTAVFNIWLTLWCVNH